MDETIQGWESFKDINLNIEFQGVDDDMLNERYELVQKIMRKLDSLPSEDPNSWEFQHKKYVKNYLSDIAGIKFVYDDTGNYRLNLQKFYGNKSAKLKREFEELGSNINRHYKEHIKTIYELEIDITNFLRNLDLEIVKFLFLVMRNKYKITAWFKKTWLFITNHKLNKYANRYPQNLLQKLRNECEDESFRSVKFYNGFPLPLNLQYPDYFAKEIETTYISPEPYKNITPNSKLLNLKFLAANDRWNYSYGYASSCEANKNRGKYLENIHNLNIKKKENIDGYKYYRDKIKNANQEIEKIILDSTLDTMYKQQAIDEERGNRAVIDDYLNYWIAVYNFYQDYPNYREKTNEEIENIINYPEGEPNYSEIRAKKNEQAELYFKNADYESENENGEELKPLDDDWVQEQIRLEEEKKQKKLKEEKQKKKVEKEKKQKEIENIIQEQERINNQNRYLNNNLGILIPQNSGTSSPYLPPSTAQDRMNMEQQFVELPEPGVIPMKKTVHKTKKSKIHSAQTEVLLPVPQPNGSLPIPEQPKKKKGRPRKNIPTNIPILPEPTSNSPILPEPTPNIPILPEPTPNSPILPSPKPNSRNSWNSKIDIFNHKFTWPFILNNIKPQSKNEFFYVLSELESRVLKEWEELSNQLEMNVDEQTDDYEDCATMIFNLFTLLFNKTIYARSNLKKYIEDIEKNVKQTMDFYNSFFNHTRYDMRKSLIGDLYGSLRQTIYFIKRFIYFLENNGYYDWINLGDTPGYIPIDIEKMRENLIVDPRFLSQETSKPKYNFTNDNWNIPPLPPPKPKLNFTNDSFHISPIHSPIVPVNPNASPIAPASPINSNLSSYSPISETNSSVTSSNNSPIAPVNPNVSPIAPNIPQNDNYIYNNFSSDSANLSPISSQSQKSNISTNMPKLNIDLSSSSSYSSEEDEIQQSTVQVPNYKILQQNLKSLRNQYFELRYAKKFNSLGDIQRKIDQVVKKLENMHINYIISFGNYSILKPHNRLGLPDEIYEKFKAAIFVNNIETHDWENRSESEINAFSQYDKKHRIKHLNNVDTILKQSKEILEQGGKGKGIKQRKDLIKKLVEEEKGYLFFKMWELQPPSSDWFSTSDSDVQEIK